MVVRAQSVTTIKAMGGLGQKSSRRDALVAFLAPAAGILLMAAAPANAADSKNLSRSQLLAQQRAERKEAMKAKNAKVRSGDEKPSF